MTRPSIAQIRDIGNVAQLYRWNLLFASFPSAIVEPPSRDDLNLRCETSEIPKKTGQTVDVLIRGHKVRQPGIYAPVGTLTMTFYETVDNKIHKFLEDWKEACWATNTGVAAAKAAVEASIILQRLDQGDNAIWEYKLIGAFLEDFEGGGTLDGVTSDALKPSMILSYDDYSQGPL